MPDEMTPEEMEMDKRAVEYVQRNVQGLIAKFANPARYYSVEHPVSFYMAGSPGAGKTESSRQLIESFRAADEAGIIHIDHDAIREEFRQFGYDGSNAYVFQRSASRGVEKLHDHALSERKNFILDATMHDVARAKANIKRSLSKGRTVVVGYVYQDPVVAWEFTKAREAVEGRHISKKRFIEVFFAAQASVTAVKRLFGSEIQLWVFEKNFRDFSKEKPQLNVDNIDGYVSTRYSPDTLDSLLL